MAQWRYRDPNSFPPDFLRVMRQGEGVDKLVSVRKTERGAKADQEQFRLFRFCLRQHGAHEASLHEFSLVHRTKLRWDRESGQWLLLLTSRRNVLEDVAGMT